MTKLTNALLVGLLLTAAAPAVIGAEFSVNSHLLWVPEAMRPGQLKGALFCSDYAAERSLYNDPDWRALATRHRLGFVKYAGLKGGDSKRAHATPDKSFLKAIDDLASKSGYKELADAPLVFLGVSGAGSRFIRLGAQYPKRTIACVGYHGISIHGASSSAMPFPILYAMAHRYDRLAETVWLPNARVAEAWLADHQAAAIPETNPDA